MADTAGNLPCGGRQGEERVRSGEENIEETNGVVVEETAASSSSSSSALLAELNLVMVVAFLTLSGDEISRSEEEPEKVVASEVRDAVSKTQRRRHRQPDDYKAADRSAVTRPQTKILDSRHGRKM